MYPAVEGIERQDERGDEEEERDGRGGYLQYKPISSSWAGLVNKLEKNGSRPSSPHQPVLHSSPEPFTGKSTS